MLIEQWHDRPLSDDIRHVFREAVELNVEVEIVVSHNILEGLAQCEVKSLSFDIKIFTLS